MPPEHKGYVFVEWDNDGKNITEDITITAVYEEDNFPITVGDVNRDGVINTADAVQVLKYSAGIIQLNNNQKIAADTNHDGRVNTADAVRILKYCAYMILEF